MKITNSRVAQRQIISSIGLAIIIIAVAIDPFTQQVIQYYQSTPASGVNGNATIPRNGQYDSSGARLGAGVRAPSTDMVRAVMTGIWTPNLASFAVSVSNCLTGNCSFVEPYHSLGICSSCNDISSQISGSCILGSFSSCNYTVPTGLAMSTETSFSQFLVADDVAVFTVPPPDSWLTTRRFFWVSGTGNPFPPGGDPQSRDRDTRILSRSCVSSECSRVLSLHVPPNLYRGSY